MENIVRYFTTLKVDYVSNNEKKGEENINTGTWRKRGVEPSDN